MDLNDLAFAISVSPVEICAYVAVLAYAIAKQPRADNIDAFNLRRRSAIQSVITSGSLQIFVDDSPYLSLETLTKVHNAFNLNILDRAIVLNSIVLRDTALISGKTRAFYMIFRLCAGTSLNPLMLIVRYARKYPHFYDAFPELQTEYYAANDAVVKFYEVNEKIRMYMKLIFGNAYIPIDRKDIENLLGCAVFTLAQTEATLSNYSGGMLSANHRQRLIDLLQVAEIQEEEVPEEMNETTNAN
ncbi:hypothetical protein F4813DRAFT_368731 [Daldinia decipiens]|uniref:uncharacterized protein n=1 Tax=Daldinia decipiens TaxID=326647 RepID=UPI0020C366B1|nr:uncharacterized protein F4813DRAFT_368731 [Daldinia decipiens]KAI1654866.1 hypothetical protein F4813DRAFT_368731 [Daldinia decipiens]